MDEPIFEPGKCAPLEFDQIFEAYSFDDDNLPPHLDWLDCVRYCVRDQIIADEQEAERLLRVWREHQEFSPCST